MKTDKEQLKTQDGGTKGNCIMKIKEVSKGTNSSRFKLIPILFFIYSLREHVDHNAGHSSFLSKRITELMWITHRINVTMTGHP